MKNQKIYDGIFFVACVLACLILSQKNLNANVRQSPPTSKSMLSKIENQLDSQMLKVNFQFKNKKELKESELNLPYFQTAEFLQNDYIIEINPQKTQNGQTVLMTYRLLRAKNGKVLQQGAIPTDSKRPLFLQAKGLSLKVFPVL